MNILKSNLLEKHENIEYHYIFHDLVSHKEAGEIQYAISKTNYFMSDESFQKQHEMLQEKIERDKFKDQTDVITHIANLNQEQLKAVKSKRAEFISILKKAPSSDHIKSIIQFHDELIGIFLEWLNVHELYINDSSVKKGNSKSKNKGGRPLDLELETKKNNLRKDYYDLTGKKGLKKYKALQILAKKYYWKKSTIESYLK
jgi:hypothetical protein